MNENNNQIIRRKKKVNINHSKAAYFMISPFLLFFIVTVLIPVVVSLIFSFSRVTTSIEFVGLENFRVIFNDPQFFRSYINVLFLMIFSIPITMFLALIFAVLLNLPAIKWKGFFRTVYYLPVVTSVVAVATIFMTFFQNNGLFNALLTTIGLDTIPWLARPFWARFSMVVIMVWLNLGFYIVLFLAGLQNISADVYESADIDGANGIQKFFKITVPLLKPVVLLGLILSTINGLGAFEVPNILFQGGFGPGGVATTVGVNLFNTSFMLAEFGRASAIAWTMVVVAAILSAIQFAIGGKNNEE